MTRELVEDNSYMARGKKTGGRVKGSLNRATIDLRQVLEDVVSGYHASGAAANDFELMEPKQRIDITLKMLVYVVPRPQSVTVDLSIPAVNDALIQELNRLAQESED